jgi:hypothetical protein
LTIHGPPHRGHSYCSSSGQLGELPSHLSIDDFLALSAMMTLAGPA